MAPSIERTRQHSLSHARVKSMMLSNEPGMSQSVLSSKTIRPLLHVGPPYDKIYVMELIRSHATLGCRHVRAWKVTGCERPARGFLAGAEGMEGSGVDYR